MSSAGVLRFRSGQKPVVDGSGTRWASQSPRFRIHLCFDNPCRRLKGLRRDPLQCGTHVTSPDSVSENGRPRRAGLSRGRIHPDRGCQTGGVPGQPGIPIGASGFSCHRPGKHLLYPVGGSSRSETPSSIRVMTKASAGVITCSGDGRLSDKIFPSASSIRRMETGG